MTSPFKRWLAKALFTLLFLLPLTLLVEIPIFLAGVGLGAYLVYSTDLPEIPKLVSYQPRTVSTFFADDGTVIGVFYRHRRVVIDLDQIPRNVVNAFLAAEDRRFYEHHGVDWLGLGRAAGTAVVHRRLGPGGSTITMQVTRNFFLSRDKKISRKVKEMILARQLEELWGKQKILHIYLNEIYLGEGAYGVEAAARTYFDKPVQHLSIAEAAMIAGLVASPVRYNPFKNSELARQRQATVLGRMLRAGFITEADYQKAKEEPLRVKKEVARPFDLVPDFTEAVRRYVIRKYGEERLYNEGLKVFTTCRIDFQQKAKDAVEKGLAEIKARQKHLAILRSVTQPEMTELLEKKKTPQLVEGNLYQGVVVKTATLKTKETELHVALSKKLIGRVKLAKGVTAYKVGHVLALRFDRFVEEAPYFTLDNDPQLQAALVCIEDTTGYVRALVGGASAERFQFNRATQARRQPGSAFKPVIYSVALEEKSYSPATIIVDEAIEVKMDEKAEDLWTPKNSEGGFLGPLTFRRALELSRNICTIKILMDADYDPVIHMARRMGITSPLGHNLSLSLGTSEVSLFQLTAAYTVFPNAGVYVAPVLVKRIEDRFGDVLEDNTRIPVLEESRVPKPIPREEFRNLPALYPTDPMDQQYQFDEEDLPEQEGSPDASAAPVRGPQRWTTVKTQDMKTGPDAPRVRPAMSPQTAYIMTSLLQGGVRSGTGARLSQYTNRKDLAGKTGTTNRAEDTWFIGFNPEYTAGVWVGYDEKRPLGSHEAGGRAALPIWAYFMREVLANRPEKQFPIPPEITFQDMLAYTGTPKDGFVPKIVKEPVYKPFAGKTLVLSPTDTPEMLAEYKGIVVPGVPYQPDPAYTPGAPALPVTIPQDQQMAPPPPLHPVQQPPYPPTRSVPPQGYAPAPVRQQPGPVEPRTQWPVESSPPVASSHRGGR
jgi:penicillin-binding protein 1A